MKYPLQNIGLEKSRIYMQSRTQQVWIVSTRWFMVILIIGLVLMASYDMKDLRFKTDYRMFFNDDNPQLTALDE